MTHQTKICQNCKLRLFLLSYTLMNTVTIPQKEYQNLVDTKLRFEYIRRAIDDQLFASPPQKSRKKIIATLRSTKRYSEEFMHGIARGLKRSDYFKP